VPYIPTPTPTQKLVEFSEVSISGGNLQNDDALLSKMKKKNEYRL